jgi:hypothetical protein
MTDKIAKLTEELKEMAKNPSAIGLADFCRKHSQLVDLVYNWAMDCGLCKESANRILDEFRRNILGE